MTHHDPFAVGSFDDTVDAIVRTPVEVAVLEVLADFEELVESKSAAWERLTALVESGQVRRDALRRVLIDERPIVRERAEALLTDDQSRLLAAV